MAITIAGLAPSPEQIQEFLQVFGLENVETASAAVVAAAIAAADAATNQALALGNVLAQGVGAMTVDMDGNLIAAWNEPTVTNMAITDGELIVTYP